ncbi:MAG: hypothetical protein U9Q15_02845 [Patescibacteria group bacterium]|nr:hypothetical protein [Patescibacteria group bacterium]
MCDLLSFQRAFYEKADIYVNQNYRPRGFDQASCVADIPANTSSDVENFIAILYGAPMGSNDEDVESLAFPSQYYTTEERVTKYNDYRIAKLQEDIITFSEYQELLIFVQDNLDEIFVPNYLDSLDAIPLGQVVSMKSDWDMYLSKEIDIAQRSLTLALDAIDEERYAAVIIQGLCQMGRAFYELKETMLQIRSTLTVMFSYTVNQTVEMEKNCSG